MSCTDDVYACMCLYVRMNMYYIYVRICTLQLLVFAFRELSRLLLLESAAKAAEKGKWSKNRMVHIHDCTCTGRRTLRMACAHTCTMCLCHMCTTLNKNINITCNLEKECRDCIKAEETRSGSQDMS